MDCTNAAHKRRYFTSSVLIPVDFHYIIFCDGYAWADFRSRVSVFLFLFPCSCFGCVFLVFDFMHFAWILSTIPNNAEVNWLWKKKKNEMATAQSCLWELVDWMIRGFFSAFHSVLLGCFPGHRLILSATCVPTVGLTISQNRLDKCTFPLGTFFGWLDGAFFIRNFADYLWSISCFTLLQT